MFMVPLLKARPRISALQGAAAATAAHLRLDGVIAEGGEGVAIA